MDRRLLEGVVTLDEIVTPLQIEPTDLELRFSAESDVDLTESAIRLVRHAEEQLTRRGLEQRFCPRSVIFRFPDRNIRFSTTELTLRLYPELEL